MNTFDPVRFQFIADALYGLGGFRTGDYLVQYPREAAEKFTRRKAIAWYANALRPACLRFVGYLTKRPPQREVTQPAMTEFLDSCNWQNDSLDVFWSGFMVDAKARGSMLLLVDMPQPPSTRTIPYLVAIEPERVKNYRLNAQGQLQSVTVQDWVMDKDGKPQEVLRKYTDQGWVFTGAEQASGTHALGVCPVLAFTESGLFPSEGEFATLADLSKRLYNLRSELDEILRAQTFSLLTFKTPADRFPLDLGPIAQSIGTHNLLQTFEDGAEFIAPPEGPARIYLDVIAQIESLMRQTALIVDIPSGNSQESGVALQLRFQALNASLVHFARRMEDFERRVWEVAGLWLGMVPQVSVSWSKDYSIADLKTELEIAQNMTALNAPPAYQQAKLKQLIQLDLSTLPGDELAAVLASVDEVQQEVDVAGMEALAP